MTMREMFERLRRRRAPRPQQRDWTSTLTPRDWADMPIFHPRRDEDSV